LNIVLIGMKHCGKSTLGAALAERWGCAFYDVDPLIEAVHACEKNEVLSVRELFIRYGDEHFRRVEGHVVCDLYLKLDRPGSRSVVALGGRTALNDAVCKLLNAIGLVVYLRVPPEELWTRIERSGLPPFLDATDPKGHFFALYRNREPRYKRIADLVINLNGMDPDQALDCLARKIEEHQHGR